MKKLMFVAVFGMALGLISCSDDDVVDFACDTARDGLREPVDAAIAAYRAEMTEATCNSARSAIETYESSQCGDDTFSEVLAGLPDCSTVGEDPDPGR